jgi:protocatechuate 3,4-dioxygenase beta subunit
MRYRILIAGAVIAGGTTLSLGVDFLKGPGAPRMVQAGQAACTPTPADMEGPFYKPNAPVRASIGRGLVVAGVVRTAGSCAPIPNARIEWWQVNPQGEYDDAHRATQSADGEGRYRFETNFPRAYFGRPPHIHVKVLAPDYRPLTTQIYPKAGQTEIAFDFVLSPR